MAVALTLKIGGVCVRKNSHNNLGTQSGKSRDGKNTPFETSRGIPVKEMSTLRRLQAENNHQDHHARLMSSAHLAVAA